VLVDGKPIRSCIAFAVTCDGVDVRTIEGFDDDPLMGELREGFAAHHGLQCGFCTPGMLITSRDIVMRLGETDERTIREELSGNLCRCTGYMGIVQAVRSVSLGKTPAPVARGAKMVRENDAAQGGAPPARRDGSGSAASSVGPKLAPTAAMSSATGSEAGWTEMAQQVRVAAPPDAVWEALRDVHRVAACLPGALIESFDGTNLRGALTVKFGPIRAAFGGEGTVAYEDGTSSGIIEGGGRDSRTGSQARGEIRFSVREATAGSSEIDLVLRYRITGSLAQFARSALVQNFVGHLAGVFAANLASTLSGDAQATSITAARDLNAVGVLLAVARAWVRRIFGR
jgi:carbon-monoxide dehydrogenase small subunit